MRKLVLIACILLGINNHVYASKVMYKINDVGLTYGFYPGRTYFSMELHYEHQDMPRPFFRRVYKVVALGHVSDTKGNLSAFNLKIGATPLMLHLSKKISVYSLICLRGNKEIRDIYSLQPELGIFLVSPFQHRGLSNWIFPKLAVNYAYRIPLTQEENAPYTSLFSIQAGLSIRIR